jgi:creatinine amidohydrolase
MSAINLSQVTWPEAKLLFESNNVVVLPIGGGSKEHGYHLPLGTDMYVINEITRLVFEMSDNHILILPTLNYAYFPAFVDWPGTISISSKTFIDFVSDIVRSIAKHGGKKFLILDGGVSTQPPLYIVSYDLANELNIKVAVTNISGLGNIAKSNVCNEKDGGHGDESETSCILAIHPEMVHLERAVNEKSPQIANTKDENGSTLITLKGPMVSTSGINGEPLLATPEKGRVILDAMANDVFRFLQTFLKD